MAPLAARKARAVASEVPNGALVLGVDTDVVLDGRTLGKAADEAAARERLEALSGRTHEVLSGLAVAGPGEVRTLGEMSEGFGEPTWSPDGKWIAYISRTRAARYEAKDESWQPPAGGHRMGLAFRCDTPAEVDQAHTDLVGAGYRSHLEPFDAFWGQRYATVLDPDDNPVDLFAALPETA